MANNDELHARLAADIAKMFNPPEPVEQPETVEPEGVPNGTLETEQPEPPGKGVMIPSAGNHPDYKVAEGIQESMENPFAKLMRLIEQNNG